ncbi:MAG: hypothetical protein FD165_1564 [Gammaproteobacteria bacterium]|nr:MAG: hypothetical protein FD165_1564 [Gammaproteobacteria bacterium]TND05476.1 MAG: hypothetical protein FD120_1084 [Gammaproteobacteria bacterium]
MSRPRFWRRRSSRNRWRSSNRRRDAELHAYRYGGECQIQRRQFDETHAPASSTRQPSASRYACAQTRAPAGVPKRAVAARAICQCSTPASKPSSVSHGVSFVVKWSPTVSDPHWLSAGKYAQRRRHSGAFIELQAFSSRKTPPVCGSRSAIARNINVLPLPDGPDRPMALPPGMVRLMGPTWRVRRSSMRSSFSVVSGVRVFWATLTYQDTPANRFVSQGEELWQIP